MKARHLANVALVRTVVVAGCLIAAPATLRSAELDPRDLPREVASAKADDAATVLAVSKISDTTTTDATTPSVTGADIALPVETAALGPTDAKTETAIPAAAAETDDDIITGSISAAESADECFVLDICVDRYLWALYQKAPKEDAIKVPERRQVTIKRKGRMVTVTRTFTRLVDENFAWKDPKAADRVGLAMADYVIGGMDREFKLKLFYTLRAAESAGLSPGITSAFRDDYRQEIASGLKAASNRSYHGGSLRGGYGHGMAADIVSVDGASRAQRWVATERLWKWVDAHGKEFGIGRPYLNRDPPHVGPVDGQEYVSKRGGDTTRQADTAAKKTRVAARHDRRSAKRAVAAKASIRPPMRSARNAPGRLHG